MLAYTGVGSRKTPDSIAAIMRALAMKLAGRGYLMRSGGSGKADLAFEDGALAAGGETEIYLPWRRFDKRNAGIVLDDLPVSAECYRMAEELHPAWPEGREMRQLLARDVPQVLGADLKTPSKFVVCWAPRPRLDSTGRVMDCHGGTGTAVRVAYVYGAPVFHLGVPAHAKRILDFCGADVGLLETAR